jgi:hypothetical protein
MLTAVGNLCVLYKSSSKVMIILVFLQGKQPSKVCWFSIFPLQHGRNCNLGHLPFIVARKIKILGEAEECLIVSIGCDSSDRHCTKVQSKDVFCIFWLVFLFFCKLCN